MAHPDGTDPRRVSPQATSADRVPQNLGLDLLRALAILLVVFSHCANNVAYWFGIRTPAPVFFVGDIGVDLFFALSGFLIGLILLRIVARRATPGDLGVFMARRWLRTLPVYFLWLAVLFVFLPPRHDVAQDALRFATMTQNLAWPMPADYFFAASWSLSVEEWFYLLFASALVLGAWLTRRPDVALWSCLAVFIAVPLALRIATLDWSDSGVEAEKEVILRLDQIAYGVLMARLYVGRSWLFRHPWPLLALGLLLIAGAWTNRLPVPFRLIQALSFNAAIIGCALCLPAALRLHAAPAWFAAPVRGLSRISYALYLFHLPIMVDFVQARLWGAGRLSAPAAAVVAVVLPVVLAALSYRFIEAPILRRRPRQDFAEPRVVLAQARAQAEGGVAAVPS